MEYTEEQKELFRTQFASRKRRRLKTVFAGLIVMVLFGKLKGFQWIPRWAFLISMIAGMICLIREQMKWRCPACNQSLDSEGWSPQYCSKCGAPLE